MQVKILTLKTICGTMYSVGIGVSLIERYMNTYFVRLHGGHTIEIDATKVEYVETT